MNKSRLIYLDTETIGYPEMLPDIISEDKLEELGYDLYEEVDILLELAFIIEEDSKYKFISSLNRPIIPIPYQVSAINHISNDMVGYETDLDGKLVKLPNSTKTKAYKQLEKLDGGVIIGHNIKFDLDVLDRVSFDSSKFQIIDTMKIAKHLFQSKHYIDKYSKENSELPISNVNLQFLRYFTKINTELKANKKDYIQAFNKYIEKNDLSDFNHRALSDSLVVKQLVDYYSREFNLTIENMIDMTNKPVRLIKVPYTSDKGKDFSDLANSNLTWFYNNSNDEDVVYTTGEILKERGIDVNRHYFTFGKHKDREISDKDIPDDYLFWVYHEMNNLAEPLKKGIASELMDRGYSHPDNYEKDGRNYKQIDWEEKIRDLLDPFTGGNIDEVIKLIDSNKITELNRVNEFINYCNGVSFDNKDDYNKLTITSIKNPYLLSELIKSDTSFTNEIINDHIPIISKQLSKFKKGIEIAKTDKDRYDATVQFKNYRQAVIKIKELKKDKDSSLRAERVLRDK
jgi:DNA polymerase III epsilon subunit-like protein